MTGRRLPVAVPAAAVPAAAVPAAAVRAVVVAALLLGVAACGGASSTSAGEPAGAGALTLAVRPSEPLRTGEPVTWRLVVTNPTDVDEVLTFSTGQQGEVALRAADGTEAYRWSEGMMFSQAVVEVPLPAGDEVTFSLTGPLEVEPGGYVLEASVVSDPAPEPLRADVTVVG